MSKPGVVAFKPLIRFRRGRWVASVMVFSTIYSGGLCHSVIGVGSTPANAFTAYRRRLRNYMTAGFLAE